MPNLNYTVNYVTGTPTNDSLTITNTGHNTVAVYDNGILVGTVTKRSSQRVRTFSLPDGDTITVKDEGNAVLAGTPFVLSGNPVKNY